MRRKERNRFRFPDDRKFAFTILDDTDDATVENVRPLYDLLHELGFRTTKTVWPLACPEGSSTFFAAETLADPGYRDFCLEVQARGFEVTWHCATMESSDRARTIRGLDAFRDCFGEFPTVHANHGQNRENIYWGAKRYQLAPMRALARLSGSGGPFEGEEPDSDYFWGDLCLRHCRFVRNFTFYELNTLRADPYMPYRLEATPWVNYWFSTSDAPDVHAFGRMITRANVDRLVDENGICILSTHLGKDFVIDGRVDPAVEDGLRYMASLPGWFVPVSTILEELLATRSRQYLPRPALASLEIRHALSHLRGVR